MLEWLENAAGPAYAQAVMWTALALLALVVVLVAVKVFRSLTFGTFVSGGRNRQARLAVIDATAVDSQRRLVLVRRDDVEHLIMIGGASDIVVERDIRAAEADEPLLGAEQTAPTREATAPRPVSEPSPVVPLSAASRPAASRPEPVEPAPSRVHSVAPEPAPVREPSRPVSEPQTPRPEPSPRVEPVTPRMAPAAPAAAAAAAAPAVATAASTPPTVSNDGDLDDALLQELELTLETDHSEIPSPERHDPVLDEEMDRLLGELSDDRR